MIAVYENILFLGKKKLQFVGRYVYYKAVFKGIVALFITILALKAAFAYYFQWFN